MSRWPVVTPIDWHPPHINLSAPKPPDPVTFDGPLNVLIGLHGTASAYINAAHVRQEYLSIAPTPVASLPTQKQEQEENKPGTKAPQIKPISAGAAVEHYDAAVPDPDLEKRLARHRHRPPRRG